MIWPGGDEPIGDAPIETRAMQMALIVLHAGARRVWAVPRRYWDSRPVGFSEEEIGRIQGEAEPMAFIDRDGRVNSCIARMPDNLQAEFRRRFDAIGEGD